MKHFESFTYVYDVYKVIGRKREKVDKIYKNLYHER